MVYGTRSFGAHTAYSFWYVIGNKVLAMLGQLPVDTWLSDVETCFKMARDGGVGITRVSVREASASRPRRPESSCAPGTGSRRIPIPYTAQSARGGEEAQLDRWCRSPMDSCPEFGFGVDEGERRGVSR